MSIFYVYILHSAKLNRFYTGFTSDIATRMEFHHNPEARKFTAKAQDWRLFHKIKCKNKTQALAVEAHIKSMKSHAYIENLKKYPEIGEKLLMKYE